MSDTTNQNKKILAYMRAHGSISPLEALDNGINCMRLSARIFDLKKQGFQIITKREHISSMWFARYYLMEEEKESDE